MNIKLLESELEVILARHYAELRKLKGFSLRNVKRAVVLLITAATETVPAWAEATPQERREAVVNVLNRAIDIPIIGESIEAIAIGFLYDMVLDRLNL